MNKIIVILGPTASGKSDVAIKLAQKISAIGGPASGWNGAEIISADSRQVYRGMDIGTGKVTSAEQKMAVHHMLDVADPNEEFNISHFKKLAEKKIKDILKRGKIPIICGGTGFWIQSIVDNVQLPEVKPDKVLRNMLSNKSAEELFAMLKKLDTERAENIDAKNKVRLIRAIEICKTLGKVPPQSSVISHQSSKYEFLEIGIEIEKEILDEKIKKRLGQRFSIGMTSEVQNLHENGVSWERLEYFGLEYRWIARYLQKKISLDDMMNKLYFDIIHYAKRQMTWFKRDKRILWLKDYSEIESAVKNFIK
ncbi:MAG TPA: tRNA (adenosine(37)-N6)-dimethylallyltransferase MiaA [Candidatus Moranbacteria bacterium]|nr:tRNA (adenosine(37)-N6)-dimethylallyltransferase MiaA [Candidatus Moranbacteria bacterium]HSA08458.1 tRNA (adenosine(37)-N6)-dimethylallyltransferase MiaA [Candidatus Moranbacteria bacterium]